MGKHLINLKNAILSIFLLATVSLFAGAPEWSRVNYTNSTTFVGINKITNHDNVTVGDYIGGFVDGECRMIGQFFENEGELYISAILHGGDVFGTDGDNIGELVEFRLWDNETDTEYTDIKGTTYTKPGGSIYMYPIGEGNKDNNLESLEVVDLALSPAFDSLTTAYEVNLAAGATTPTSDAIAAIAADDRASVAVEVVDDVATITVTSEFGETKEYTITFIAGDCPLTAPSADDKTVCEKGDYTLEASSETAGVSFKWYTKEDLSDTPVEGDTFTPEAAGTFYVTQSDDNCESSAAPVVLTTTPLPAAPSIDDAGYCAGEAGVEVTTDGTNVTIYSDEALTQEVTGIITEGTYYATDKDANGCLSEASSFAVTEIALPEITLTPSATTACISGEGITFEVSPAGGTLVGDGISNDVFDPATAGLGEHTITYTASNEAGCENSTEVVITVTKASLPTASNVTINVGDPVTALVAEGAGTITWYDSEGAELSKDNPYTPTSVDNSKEGSYTFYVTNTDGDCESPIEQVEVLYTVNDCGITAPDVDKEVQDICAGDDMPTFKATPSDAANTIKWFATSDLSDTPVEGVEFTPEAAGTYYVVEEGTCQSPATIVKVNENALPVITFNKEVPSTMCSNGEAIDLAEYLSGDGTFTGVTTEPSTFDPSEASTGANEISYNVVNENNCAETTKFTITVEAAPTSDIVFPASVQVGTTHNFGELAGTLTGTGVEQDGNSWTFTPPSVGVFTLKYTIDGNCKLEISKPIQGSIGACPDAPSVDVSTGDVPSLTVVPAESGNTITWYADADLSDELSTGETYSTDAIGTHQAYVVETNSNCSSEATLVEWTVSENPCVTPDAPTAEDVTACEGTEYALTASGTAIKWYESETSSTAIAETASFKPTEAGTYYATQTVDGCESGKTAATLSLNTVPAKPEVDNISVAEGETVPAFEIKNKETGATVTWNGTDEGDSFQSTETAADTYTYTVVQSNGCGDSEEATVTLTIQSDECTAYVTAPTVADASDICEGAATPELSASTSISGAVIVWYNSNDAKEADGETFTPSVSAADTYTYYAVAESADGACSTGKSEVSFTINERPTVSITLSAEYSSETAIVEPVVSPIGGTLFIDGVEQSSVSFSPKTLGAGTYTANYVFETAAGCSANDEVSFEVKSGIVYTELEEAIKAAKEKYDAAADSVPDYYSEDDYKALADAIAAAEAVVDNATAQAEVTTAIDNLEAAVKTFVESKNDIVALNIEEITIAEDGSSFTITFDGPVSTDALADINNFTFKVNGDEVLASIAQVSNSPEKVTITLNTVGGDVVSIKYSGSIYFESIAEIITMTGIGETALESVILYPTIAKAQVTITGAEAVTELSIANSALQNIACDVVLGSTIVIDVDGLPSGVYYVTVKAGTAVKTLEFIK